MKNKRPLTCRWFALAVVGLLTWGAVADEPPRKDGDRPPLTPADIQKQREEEARRRAQENLKQLGLAAQQVPDAAGQGPAVPNYLLSILPYIEQNNLYGMTKPNRLGAEIKPAGDDLAAALKLPKGVGQVLGDIKAGSAAGKAGLQKHDVLVELNGKPAPRDASEFAKLLDGLKAKDSVKAVVLRGGERTEVKDVRLPEAGTDPFKELPLKPLGILDGASNTLMFAENPWATWGNYGWGGPGDSGVLTTTFRQQERFTTRYQEGSLIITVTGTVKDGNTEVGAIKVQDGSAVNRYTSLKTVPVEYRDKVASLVADKRQGQLEIKKP